MVTPIETRSDEVARLYSTAGCIFNPYKHKIIETDWIRCARRQTGRPKLFLYFHTKSKNFVLAHWIVEPKTGKGPGLMMELEVFKGHPDKYTGYHGTCLNRPNMGYIRARCQPMKDMLKDFDKEQARLAYEERAAEEETEVQRSSLVRWLDRKGPRFQEIADALRSGEAEFIGDREGGQALKEFREGL